MLSRTKAHFYILNWFDKQTFGFQKYSVACSALTNDH